MKKSQLHKLIKEELQDLLNETTTLSLGDHDFDFKLAVNKNPTKEGIKIQLFPKGEIELNQDLKDKIQDQIQTSINSTFKGISLQINDDPDANQSVGPNAIAYYKPLESFKNLFVKVLQGA